MSPQLERIPVLIVSGFLGAGKTTFIRDLIPRLAAGPRAPYVILNDFLNAAIDAFSLKGLGAEIKGLAAGCVCCDDPTSLLDAILRIPTEIRPILIIEANGTTDPFRLIEILTLNARSRNASVPSSKSPSSTNPAGENAGCPATNTPNAPRSAPPAPSSPTAAKPPPTNKNANSATICWNSTRVPHASTSIRSPSFS